MRAKSKLRCAPNATCLYFWRYLWRFESEMDGALWTLRFAFILEFMLTLSLISIFPRCFYRTFVRGPRNLVSLYCCHPRSSRIFLPLAFQVSINKPPPSSSRPSLYICWPVSSSVSRVTSHLVHSGVTLLSFVRQLSFASHSSTFLSSEAGNH